MNAPHPDFLPSLPPLSPHPPAGTAPRFESVQLGNLGAVEPGFSAVIQDAGEPLYRPCDPSPLPDPKWLAISERGARLIGLSQDSIQRSNAWLSWMSGNAAIDALQPYACVYAGHQFGVFVPRLGDGRALNLGAIGGWELQLKGAGPTPYARFADGRAVLRSSVREFLCSEAMHALGIPTTRVLSLVTSPQPVIRESLETAAVVCRMAPSFVRFGSFQYFSSRGRLDSLEALIRSVWPLYFSHQTLADAHDPRRFAQAQEEARSCALDQLAIMLLQETSVRTAELMAQWMSVGFMHGVMNTDNFSILGLTLDYGPFGFMDGFDAGHICNHSDHMGRYSYHAQPQVGLWNVAQLCQALHRVIDNANQLQDIVTQYKSSYAASMDRLLRSKFGLAHLGDEIWSPLSDDFYTLLQSQQMDVTLAFRALAKNDEDFLALAKDRDAALTWLTRYREACALDTASGGPSDSERHEKMNAVNPKYVLRNWVAEEVIRAVRDDGNTQVFEDVYRALQSPYAEHPDLERFAAPPPQWANDLCVSCSS